MNCQYRLFTGQYFSVMPLALNPRVGCRHGMRQFERNDSLLCQTLGTDQLELTFKILIGMCRILGISLCNDSEPAEALNDFFKPFYYDPYYLTLQRKWHDIFRNKGQANIAPCWWEELQSHMAEGVDRGKRKNWAIFVAHLKRYEKKGCRQKHRKVILEAFPSTIQKSFFSKYNLNQKDCHSEL